MNRHSLTLAIAATLAVLGGAPALAQDKAAAPAAPAKAAPAAPAKAAAAAPGKEIYPKQYYDLLLKERLAQGQADSPELRNALKEELNTRELIVREAKKKGLDKDTDVKTQMDLTAQTVLVRAYVADWIKTHPVPDETLKKEYEAIKAQMGDKEYKVRHILVDKEDEAKEIIAALQKGEKFEKLAERSKDPGSKANGGDLDWNAPGNFVKPFSDAMVKLPKGKFTTQPVQTQFGWHVIEVDDIREAKVPPFDEVKPQLTQRMQGQQLDLYFKELRAKNGM
ncbi:MAG TPA: peptidylprolyl isomerase [Casimicrobiaceae bacterium]|jgi:peptidyl-prolyl cis-trans isomerase C|nr:peptidylprolyl isomerase [Casimicrobiaceae bacterium]